MVMSGTAAAWLLARLSEGGLGRGNEDGTKTRGSHWKPREGEKD